MNIRPKDYTRLMDSARWLHDNTTANATFRPVEFRDGDQNYPLIVTGSYTIQGWNGMVLKDGEVVYRPPKRRAWWNGGGDHLTFSDGSSRFNTHMRPDSRNMIGNEVIEDLASPRRSTGRCRMSSRGSNNNPLGRIAEGIWWIREVDHHAAHKLSIQSLEYRDGDKNYPMLQWDSYTIQGWNGMVLKDGAVVYRPPKRKAWWNGGGDHLTFSDGSFRFNPHMQRDTRNMVTNAVIEDLAGPSVEKKFPQHYVRLEDGREGVSTEGLSRDALKTIYRETGQAEGGAGDPRPDLMDKLRKRAQASAKKAGVEL